MCCCFSSVNTAGIGSVLYVVGTPFGNLSPAVFLNSISKCVLSNVAGADQDLLLTDARCIPGTEGGAIYTQSWRDNTLPFGVVVAPLCWKANEWVRLSVGCRLSSILNSLDNVLDLKLDQGALRNNLF